MEIFREMGVADALYKNRLPQNRRHIEWVESVGQLPLYTQPLGRSMEPFSPETTLMATEYSVEQLLLDTLKRRCPDNILLGKEVIQIDEREDKIYVALDGNPCDIIESDYLLCTEETPHLDKFGFEMVGYSGLGYHLHISFRAPIDPPLSELTLFTSPKLFGRFIQALDDKNLYLLGMQLPPNSPPVTQEEALQIVRDTLSNSYDIELVDVTSYPIEAKIASPYCQGRIFLAGDAAHKLPPSANMGMNCGIQDAHNIAWKLAAAVAGWASGELLFSYFPERGHAAEAHIAYGADAKNRFRPLFEAIQAQNASQITEEIAKLDQPISYLSQDVGLTYSRGCLLLPEAFRAPHFHLPDGRPIQTLFGSSFVLLTGHAGQRWREALSQPLPIRLQQIPDEALSLYNISPSGAALVRPDGYVAWSTPEAPSNPTATLTESLTQLLQQT